MDYPIGQAATVAFVVRDRLTGQPLTSGVTVGAWSLYGPASTTALLVSAAATARGAGVYSVLIPAVNLVTPGTYRLAYAITAPTDAVGTEEIAFTVGPVVRGAWTLRDLLVSLVRGTGGIVRPSQLINAAVVTDSYWSNSVTTLIPGEAFNGSEVVLIDPSGAATYADWFVGRVQSFTNSTGAFTLNRTTGLAADSTGRQYALCNVGGTGFMWEHILEELRVAYDEVQPTMLTSLSVGVETVGNQLEYALPDNLVTLRSVSVKDLGGGDVWDNLDGYWELLGDRRYLRLNEGLGLGAGHSLRLEGAVRCELPRLGGGYTDMPGVWLRERVRWGLLSSSPAPAHQRTAAQVYANLARMPVPHRPPSPGERRVA